MTDTEYAIRPNKTQLKREMRALNDLAKQLTLLTEGALNKIPLTSAILPAIIEARKLSRGALQRQLRRITTLLLNEDTEAIQRELQRQLQPDKEQTALFHKLEDWRERLIDGDDVLLTQIVDENPDIDRQQFRQMVRNAQVERKSNKPPKVYRQLFQFLKNL